jgi:hypothetical protein
VVLGSEIATVNQQLWRRVVDSFANRLRKCIGNGDHLQNAIYQTEQTKNKPLLLYIKLVHFILTLSCVK